SINGIERIKSITSVSREGRSQITVEFDLDADLNAAANDVRDRVSRSMSNLPLDVDPPVIAKADADATPIVMVTLQSNTRNLMQISDYVNRVLKERLQTIPGVSQVQIWGEKRFAIRLWFEPAKMAASNITAAEINTALQNENVELPSGRIEGNRTELTIKAKGLLKDAEEFNNLIIKVTDGKIIRLKDVGFAELGVENERTIFRTNGVPLIGLSLIPQPGSNHIEIADEFYKRLGNIRKELPSDMRLDVGFDMTKFIRESILEVEQSLLIAFVLVIIIIFLFLREWRSTFIPILAIPVSLIFAFFIMYVAGFSINVLTLLGLVLAIGIVVDDAIIVLENIFSKIENGENAVTAGENGTQEIFFAVVSTTITLASIFLPVIFLQGMVGRLFREFGIVIAGAVAVSAFVALTLTPMLSVKFFKKFHTHSKFYKKTEPFFQGMANKYKAWLSGFISNKWYALIIILVSIVFIFIFGSQLQSELAPVEDRSMLRGSVLAAEGTSYEYMDEVMQIIADTTIASIPENAGVIALTAPGFSSGSANSGALRIMLSERDERKRSQQEIFRFLAAKLQQFTNVKVTVIQEQTIGSRGRGLPVQFVLQASNIEKLRKIIPVFIQKVNQNKAFTMADVNLKFNKPQIDIMVDRDKARELGISMADVAKTMQLLFSGRRYGYYIMDGKQYQIIGQVQRQDRYRPDDISDIYVTNAAGKQVSLKSIIKTGESSAPPQLYRYNRYVAATISAGLAPGYTIGDGLEEMEKIGKETLDETFSTAYDGASRDFKESSSSLSFTFLFALIFIYLILAAQFESFRSPLIVMFTVPLALGGAVFSLWYFNQTLNIFSEIGMIMLIGLVTKNGILIVEFANQRREQGLAKLQAVLDASAQRLRPILMTSLS
ncbi:MAG: efflux RND transporter permease subunit, partial [Ignavibacteriales bacterium]|nr:efflux RND transporter permease subunit [Ignavibacteriales bacterium]